MECRAFTLPGGKGNLSAHLFYNRVRDAQAKSGTTFLAGVGTISLGELVE